MATCKDCIHYDVCVIVEHRVDEDEDYLSEFGCENFINKNDVVEVVRCKDCIYKIKNAWGLGIICDKIGAYMPTENDFCSYGKKVE